MKESLISISKPAPKPLPQEESELPSNLTEPEDVSMSEELPEPEPTYISQPASMSFANNHSSGWKVSDILREIRLDNFDMGGPD